MEINASMVKQLREQTGAGMMACKMALQEASGDLAQAVIVLRKKGLAAAAKKSGRTTAEGAVLSYVHAGGKIGVLVEVNCETDFVAKTDDFTGLVKDIAMHVAASRPEWVRRDDVPADIQERERAIFREAAVATGKPEKVIDKIVDGKMDRFFQNVCLLDQAFVKDPDHSVQDIVHAAVAKLGENIQVRRFVRFGLGEELDEGGQVSSLPPGAEATSH
ncbi:MAG: translation elongation factor Ts [Acidobacteriota bacterium]